MNHKKYGVLVTALIVLLMFALSPSAEASDIHKDKVLKIGRSYSGVLNDDTDYEIWKFSIPTDGDLKFYISLNSSSLRGATALLLESNGINEIERDYAANGNIVFHGYLEPGSYILKVSRDLSQHNGSGEYTINSDFTAEPFTNDVEPNNIAKRAIELPIGALMTGHLGYYSETINENDTVDWYKITLPFDQLLTIKINFNNPSLKGAQPSLYDSDGHYILNRGYQVDGNTVIKEKLKKGTYLLKVEGNSTFYDGQGGYSIRCTGES